MIYLCIYNSTLSKFTIHDFYNNVEDTYYSISTVDGHATAYYKLGFVSNRATKAFEYTIPDVLNMVDLDIEIRMHNLEKLVYDKIFSSL